MMKVKREAFVTACGRIREKGELILGEKEKRG
jgi:hypothetical protein